VVKSKAGRWICLVCALSSVAFLEAQKTSPLPAADAVTQFDGKFRASSAKGFEEAYLEKLFGTSHAANLVRLDNGDLLCFWFSGTWEGESNVAIVMSRLPKGSEQWSRTVEIDHQEGRSFQNPVAFQVADGRLWLLHISQPARQGQANAEVLYLKSDDAGQTWTNPRPLFTEPGSFIRHPPVLISKNNWLLPMYYTPSRSIIDGAESHYSAVRITSDAGKSWRECGVPQSNGLVQQSILRLATGRFVGFFRSRYADFIYKDTSEDGCDWTVPAPTHLPNNNSSIQLAMLKDGSLVIAFNNNSAGVTRDKTSVSVRRPLSIALSQDSGETWPWIRDLETGRSAGQDSGAPVDIVTDDEYSYPSVLQDANGKIVIAYTYRRETIKVVRFDEEWIKQNNTVGKFKGDSRRQSASQVAADHHYEEIKYDELHTTRYLDDRFGGFCSVSACQHPLGGERNQCSKKDEGRCGWQACSANLELLENAEHTPPVAQGWEIRDLYPLGRIFRPGFWEEWHLVRPQYIYQSGF